VSFETELHLNHEIRRPGWDAPVSMLVTTVSKEIDRLDREADTLRKLGAELRGVG
jgi:hypothetical protein